MSPCGTASTAPFAGRPIAIALSVRDAGAVGACVTSAIDGVDIEQAFGMDREGPLAVRVFGWPALAVVTAAFDLASMVCQVSDFPLP